MPAPVVRSRSLRSCTRTLQPCCARAQAAVRAAKPAPTISACRLLMVACSWRQDYYHGCEPGEASPNGGLSMARLRHFAVCVNDLAKAAKFYETVFDLKRIAREDLDIGSAIYMSDGTINLALLNFSTGA